MDHEKSGQKNNSQLNRSAERASNFPSFGNRLKWRPISLINARLKILTIITLTLFSLSGLIGCSTEGIVGGVAGTTLLLGNTPTHQFEQIYYLGVFDPQEQLPPTVYRVIVRGQAGATSATNFASGWVPANAVDSLSSRVAFDRDDPMAKVTPGKDGPLEDFKTGRRLMLFGPEGFREAPKNHRLVIVMGSDPHEYFDAINDALGTVSRVRADQLNNELKTKLFEALLKLKNERERLKDLEADVKVKFAK